MLAFILTPFSLSRQCPDTHIVVPVVPSTPDPSPSFPLPELPPHLLLPHSLYFTLFATLHGTVEPLPPGDDSDDAPPCHQ